MRTPVAVTEPAFTLRALAVSVTAPAPDSVPPIFRVLPASLMLSVLPVAIEEVPSDKVEAEPVRVTL